MFRRIRSQIGVWLTCMSEVMGLGDEWTVCRVRPGALHFESRNRTGRKLQRQTTKC